MPSRTQSVASITTAPTSLSDDLAMRTRRYLWTMGLRTACFVNGASTVAHSFSFVFFPMFTPFQAAVQSMLFLGMGVGSIITTAGYRPFTLMHICIGLLPLFGLWAWSGLAGPGGSIALAVACIGLGYCVSLLFIAGRIFAAFQQSLETRQRLHEALQTAESASAAKTRFLAAASHDLRQPIHTLSLFNATLRRQELDPHSRYIADNMESAIRALTSQLDALLDISKLDAGVVPVRRTDFDLRNTVDWLAEEFAQSAQEQGIKLEVKCPRNAVVHTDAALLESILNNLVSNAVNHNSDCKISLVVAPEPFGYCISVIDDGQGIPVDEQHRIFEEFYQLHNAERDRSKGLGLGLAIVSRLAKLLELDMEFESAVGRGPRFDLMVPAGTLKAEPAGTAVAAKPQIDELSVLVVDDEAAVCDGMKVLLESFGCSVNTADGTDTAIAAAAARRPDLVLLDFRLRDQDSGLITLEKLRRLWPGLPAIMISGDTAPERLQQARAAGIPLLTKPVPSEALREAMGNACNSQGVTT